MNNNHNVYKNISNNKKLLNPRVRPHWLDLRKVSQKWYYIGFLVSYLLLQQTEVRYKDHKFSINFFYKNTKNDDIKSVPFTNPFLLTSKNEQAKSVKKHKFISLKKINEKPINEEPVKQLIEKLPILPSWDNDHHIRIQNNYGNSVEKLSIFSRNSIKLYDLVDTIQPLNDISKNNIFQKGVKKKNNLENRNKTQIKRSYVMSFKPVHEVDLGWDLEPFKQSFLHGYSVNKSQIDERIRFENSKLKEVDIANILLSWDDMTSSPDHENIKDNTIKEAIRQLKTCQKILTSQLKLQDGIQKELVAKSIEHVDSSSTKRSKKPVSLYDKQWCTVLELLELLSSTSAFKRGTFTKIIEQKIKSNEELTEDEIKKIRFIDAGSVGRSLKIPINSDKNEIFKKPKVEKTRNMWTRRFLRKRAEKYSRVSSAHQSNTQGLLGGIKRHIPKKIVSDTHILEAYNSLVNKFLSLILQGLFPVMNLRMTDESKTSTFLNPDSVTQFNIKLIDIIRKNIEILTEFDFLPESIIDISQDEITSIPLNVSEETFLNEKEILRNPISNEIRVQKIEENFYNLKALIGEARSFITFYPDENSIVKLSKERSAPFSSFSEGDQIRIYPPDSKVIKMYSRVKDCFNSLEDSSGRSEKWNKKEIGPIKVKDEKLEGLDFDLELLRSYWPNISKERDQQVRRAFRRIRRTRRFLKRIYNQAHDEEKRLIAEAKKKYEAELKQKKKEEEEAKKAKEEEERQAEKKRLEEELKKLTPEQREERKRREKQEKKDIETKKREDEKKKREEEKKRKQEEKRKKQEEEKSLTPQQKLERKQAERQRKEEEKKKEKERKEKEKKDAEAAERKRKNDEEIAFRKWLSPEDREAIDNAHKLSFLMELQFSEFDIKRSEFKTDEKAIKIFRRTQKQISESLLSRLTETYSIEKYMQSLKQKSQTQNDWGFLEMHNEFRKLQLRTTFYNIVKHNKISMVGPLTFRSRYDIHSPFTGSEYKEGITDKGVIELITQPKLTDEEKELKRLEAERHMRNQKRFGFLRIGRKNTSIDFKRSKSKKGGKKKSVFYPVTDGLERNEFEENAETFLKGHYTEDCSRNKMYHIDKTSNWINHRLEKNFARLKQQTANVQFLLENRKKMVVKTHLNEILIPGLRSYNIRTYLNDELVLMTPEIFKFKNIDPQYTNVRFRGSNLLNFSSIGNITLENNILKMVTTRLKAEIDTQVDQNELVPRVADYGNQRHWTLDQPLRALDLSGKKRLYNEDKELVKCWKRFFRKQKVRTLGNASEFYDQTLLNLLDAEFLSPLNTVKRSQSDYLHPVYGNRLKSANSMASLQANRYQNKFDFIILKNRKRRKLKRILPLPRILFRSRRKPNRYIVVQQHIANSDEGYKKALSIPTTAERLVEFQKNVVGSSMVYDDIIYSKKLKDTQNIMLSNLHLQNLAINEYHKIHTQFLNDKNSELNDYSTQTFNQHVSLRLQSYYGTDSVSNSIINTMRKINRKPQIHSEIFSGDDIINRLNRLFYIFTKIGRRSWNLKTTNFAKYAKRVSRKALSDVLSNYDKIEPALLEDIPHKAPPYEDFFIGRHIDAFYYTLPYENRVLQTHLQTVQILSEKKNLWILHRPCVHHEQLLYALRQRNARLLNIESLLAKFKSNLEGRTFGNDELSSFKMPHYMERLASYISLNPLLNSEIEYGQDFEKNLDRCLDTIEYWLLANIQDENYTRSYLHGNDYLRRDRSMKVASKNKTKYSQNIRKRKLENLTRTLLLADSSEWPNWILSRVDNSKREALLNTQAVETDSLHRLESPQDLKEYKNVTKRYKSKRSTDGDLLFRSNKQRKIVSEERFETYPYALSPPFEETESHVGIGRTFDYAVFTQPKKDTPLIKKRLKTHSRTLRRVALENPIEKFTTRKMRRLFRFFEKTKQIPINKKIKPKKIIKMGYLNPQLQEVADSFDLENLLMDAYVAETDLVEDKPIPIHSTLGDTDDSPFRTYLRYFLENNLDFKIPKTPEYNPSFGGPIVEVIHTTLLPSPIEEDSFNLVNVPGFYSSPTLQTKNESFIFSDQRLQKWKPFLDGIVDPINSRVPELEPYYLQPKPIISFLKNKVYRGAGNISDDNETRFTNSLEDFKRDCGILESIPEKRKEILDRLIDTNISQPNKTLSYFHNLSYVPEGEQAQDSKFLSMERPQTGKSPRVIWVGPGTTTHDQFIIMSMMIGYIIYVCHLIVNRLMKCPTMSEIQGFLSEQTFKTKFPKQAFEINYLKPDQIQYLLQNWVTKRSILLDLYITRTPKASPLFWGKVHDYSSSVLEPKYLFDEHKTLFKFSHNPKIWYNCGFAEKYFTLFGLGSPVATQRWIQTLFLTSNLNLINIDLYTFYKRRRRFTPKKGTSTESSSGGGGGGSQVLRGSGTGGGLKDLEGFFFRMFLRAIRNPKRNTRFPTYTFRRIIRMARNYGPGFFILNGFDRLVLSHKGFDTNTETVRYWSGGVYGTFGIIKNPNPDLNKFEEEIVRVVCNLVATFENRQSLSVCLPLPDSTRLDYRLTLPTRFVFKYFLDDDLQLLAKDRYLENRPVIKTRIPLDFPHLPTEIDLSRKYSNYYLTRYSLLSNKFRPNQNELIDNNIIIPTFEKIQNFEEQSTIYPILYQVRDLASPIEYSNGYIHDYIFATIFNRYRVSNRYRFQRWKLVSYRFMENWAQIRGLRKRAIFEYTVNWRTPQPVIPISTIKNERKLEIINKRRTSQIRFYLNMYRYVSLLAIIESFNEKKSTESE